MAEKKETPKEENKEELTKTEIIEKSLEAEEQSDEEEKEVQEVKRDERVGIVYIYASSNNTIVHITDLSGNTISRVSGGMVTKHSRLKSNPTTAIFVAKKAAERAKDLGITSLYVRIKGQTNAVGLGPGAHAAVKSLSKEGFRIISILDTTKFPRGGPKKKGGKRGRRV
jgi:small subunit ribosomal protein S11